MVIDRRELLSYLGYRGQEMTKELDEKINQAISICEKLVQPRSVVKRFKVDKETKSIVGTTLKLPGEDIWKHIEGCSEIYLLCGTIGFNVEKEIAKNFVKDKTLAIILDAAATSAIESYLDDIEKTLDGKLTTRYSCGYGDLNIEIQKEICAVLDTFRKIGVYVNEAYMLSPQKSVTAIIGVIDEL
ncbi:MAG: methionine synthase [Clostridia bacterium]|jgi:hypothetical protein|nr:methionine synthase [Clostridia bacterium]